MRRDGGFIAWQPDMLLGADVHGATLGIVGYGRIGKAVARRAEGFEMNVIHAGRAGGAPLERAARAIGFRHPPRAADAETTRTTSRRARSAR